MVVVLLFISFKSSGLGTIDNIPSFGHDVEERRNSLDLGVIPSNILEGGSIAPKLENATAKYVAPSSEHFPVLTSHLQIGPSLAVPVGNYFTP